MKKTIETLLKLGWGIVPERIEPTTRHPSRATDMISMLRTCGTHVGYGEAHGQYYVLDGWAYLIGQHDETHSEVWKLCDWFDFCEARRAGCVWDWSPVWGDI